MFRSGHSYSIDWDMAPQIPNGERGCDKFGNWLPDEPDPDDGCTNLIDGAEVRQRRHFF